MTDIHNRRYAKISDLIKALGFENYGKIQNTTFGWVSYLADKKQWLHITWDITKVAMTSKVSFTNEVCIPESKLIESDLTVWNGSVSKWVEVYAIVQEEIPQLPALGKCPAHVARFMRYVRELGKNPRTGYVKKAGGIHKFENGVGKYIAALQDHFEDDDEVSEIVDALADTFDLIFACHNYVALEYQRRNTGLREDGTLVFRDWFIPLTTNGYIDDRRKRNRW